MSNNMVGERIKRMREEVDLTQTELAAEVGLTRLSISNYELGKRTPDLATIEKLSVFFGCDTDYLIGKADYKNNAIAAEFVSSVDHLNDALKKFDSTQIQNLLDSLEIFLGISIKMSDSDAAQKGIDLLTCFIRDLTAIGFGMQLFSDKNRETLAKEQLSTALISMHLQKGDLIGNVNGRLDEMIGKAQALAKIDRIDFHETFINMAKRKENMI